MKSKQPLVTLRSLSKLTLPIRALHMNKETKTTLVSTYLMFALQNRTCHILQPANLGGGF